MHVFPNPTTGNEVTVEIKGIKDAETIPVSIYDQMGREWMKQILVVDPNSGTASGLFAFEKGLPKGMYLIKAGPSQVLIKKFVVLEK
jgi:hypothetical protein